jgi:hypothetical protein
LPFSVLPVPAKNSRLIAVPIPFFVCFALSAILTDFPTAFLSPLLMNALEDLAVKNTAVSFPNPMALRLFVGGAFHGRYEDWHLCTRLRSFR